MTTKTSASADTGPPTAVTPKQSPKPLTGSRMWSSRLICALFLAGLLIPGVIFAFALPVWLLTKSFTPAPYDGPPATTATARAS